ncbi:MAG: TonB-dependent receptor [Thermoanaerobaculia bacterium]
MRFRLSATILIAILLAAAGPAWADGSQTGSIGGVVKNAEAGPLPGVLVTVTGVTTNLKRTAVTGNNGAYTLPLLPIGDYRIEVVLQGFETVTSKVSVYTGRNTQFDANVKLSSVAATVAVTGEQPVVDKTNTTAGATVNANFTQKLPIARQYQSTLLMAPGISGSTNGNPFVRGSLSSSNVFLFDGVDTTDTTTGTFGQNFNNEAIQEIAVNTGGYSAEYGRASGAIVSVVTKTGTNSFHGSAKLIFNNDAWDAPNKEPNEVTGVVTPRNRYDQVQYRYSGTLGGPFIKDHLWFFGAYEYAPTTTPETQLIYTNETYQQDRKITLWQAKVNWQVTPNHAVEASANGDPFDGIVRNDYWGTQYTAEPESATAQKQGGSTYRGFYSGILSPNVSLEATVATAKSRIDVNQYVTNPTNPYYVFNGVKTSMAEAKAPHYDLSKDLYFNGATFDGYVERPRTQANLAVNWYKQMFGGNHQIKGGIDYQDLSSDALFAYPDNALYYDDEFDYQTRQFVPNTQEIYDPPAASSSKGKIWAFYLQDKMDFGRLFLNVGVRVDSQSGKSDLGQSVFDATVVAPRISAKWDLTGRAKTLLSFNYGLFYQSLIQNFADGYAGVPQQTNKNVYYFDSATGKFVFDSRVEGGGNSTAVNNSLKPSYTQDISLGFEQQIGPVLGVALRGNWREWKDLIDDVRTYNATTKVRTLDYVNYGPADRTYKSLEVVVDKRFANNWQGFLSYTLSKTDGNSFTDFSSALGDYLDSPATRSGVTSTGAIINEGNKDGLASYDRTHDIKAYGAYVFNTGRFTITPGSTLGWRSGNTYQRQVSGWTIAGNSYTQFTSERGSDRFPSQFYWDLGLGVDFRLFSEVNVGLRADIYNVTDTQTKLSGSLTDGPNYGKATSTVTNYATPRRFLYQVIITF